MAIPTEHHLIPGESFPSYFASQFGVSASIPSHVAVEFKLATPQDDARRQPGQTVCRVYLSPPAFKSLTKMLTGALADWESKMGTIELPEGPDWVPPMMR